MTVSDAFRARLDELAADVGRLRRRVEPDSSLAFLADRIARHVESLHLLTTPSAGEIVSTTYPGDDETVEEAIRLVDARSARLRGLLGSKAAV